MKTRGKGRMTALEFAALRPLLRNEPERVEVARLVLVEGMTHEAAGQQYGLSRQNVSSLMVMVLRVHERFVRAQAEADAAVAALLPPGWERATVVAPKALLAKLREDAAQALQEQAGGRPEKSPTRSRASGRRST